MRKVEMEKRMLEEYTRDELVAEAFALLVALTPEQLREVMEEMGLNVGEIGFIDVVGA